MASSSRECPVSIPRAYRAGNGPHTPSGPSQEAGWSDRMQADLGECRAGLADLLGGRRGHPGAGVVQAERGVLGGAERVEGEHIDPFDVSEGRGEPGDGGDVAGVVGPAGDEDEAYPHRLVAGGETAGERERRSDVAAGHPPGGGGVERLDVEQDQVGSVQQFVVGPDTEVAGRVERGVQAEVLRAGQDGPGERGLQQRLASGDGQPPAGGADAIAGTARPGPARRPRSSAARSGRTRYPGCGSTRSAAGSLR